MSFPKAITLTITKTFQAPKVASLVRATPADSKIRAALLFVLGAALLATMTLP